MKNLQIDEHNNKDIIKANKFIAEFMWGTPNREEGVNVWTIPDDNRGIFWSLSLHYEETGEAREDELYFHSSWDWLMSVVEKIDDMLADDDFVTISYNQCLIEIHNTSWLFNILAKGPDSLTIEGSGNTRIEATWNAICEFITWYNENNK